MAFAVQARSRRRSSVRVTKRKMGGRALLSDLRAFLASDDYGPVLLEVRNMEALEARLSAGDASDGSAVSVLLGLTSLEAAEAVERRAEVLLDPAAYPAATRLLLDDAPLGPPADATLRQALDALRRALAAPPTADRGTEVQLRGEAVGAGPDVAGPSKQDDEVALEVAGCAAVLPADVALNYDAAESSLSFLLPLEGLSELSAEAWGLVLGEPLLVRLARVHTQLPEPSVVLQSEPDRPTAAAKQLEKIAERWLALHWTRQPPEAAPEPPKAKKGRGRKKAAVAGPPVVENRLEGLFRHLSTRLGTLAQHCLVCDAGLRFPGLLPWTCGSAECGFLYEALGPLSGSAEAAEEASLVHLQLSLFREALHAPHAARLIDPWPELKDDNANFLAKLVTKKQTLGSLEEVVAALPCPAQLFRWRWSLALAEAHPLALPLARWLLSTNRTFLQPLQPHRRLHSMATPFQYMMVADSAEKEASFVAAVEESGRPSRFFFHGSGIQNWHSILRKGLLKASGTVLQVNGAAYGAGVYLSPFSAYSATYSGAPRVVGAAPRPKKATKRPAQPAAPVPAGAPAPAAPAAQAGPPPAKRAKGGPSECPLSAEAGHECSAGGTFLAGAEAFCLAVCEVVDSPALEDKTICQSIWTLQEPLHCATRFLLLYPRAGDIPHVDLRTPASEAEVRQSLALRTELLQGLGL